MSKGKSENPKSDGLDHMGKGFLIVITKFLKKPYSFNEINPSVTTKGINEEDIIFVSQRQDY